MKNHWKEISLILQQAIISIYTLRKFQRNPYCRWRHSELEEYIVEETIEELMKKLAIENDFCGRHIEGYDFEGCTPSVRLEFTNDKIWEASLTDTFWGNSVPCSFCSEEYIERAISEGETAIEALRNLYSYCLTQRSNGAILCCIDD